MEEWRRVFRVAAPMLPQLGLEALESALRTDDPALLQGATTMPPPSVCVQDWPVKGACLLGYCGWKGDGLETVTKVEEYFARMCFDMDMAIGERAACRWLLNAYDEWPRDEMRRQLLPEVRLELDRRAALQVG